MSRLSRVLTERLMRKLWASWRSGIEDSVVPGCGGVVFLGDSITHIGRWDLLFPGVAVRNFGVSGERTVHVLTRLAPVLQVQPQKIFLLIGTNDLASGVSTAEICANVGEILDRLATQLPACRLYLQGVMPRAKKYAPAVKALNAAYRALAEPRGITFIDLFPTFDDGNGEIAAHFTYDRLHLMGAGYAAWRALLQPYIDEPIVR